MNEILAVVFVIAVYYGLTEIVLRGLVLLIWIKKKMSKQKTDHSPKAWHPAERNKF